MSEAVTSVRLDRWLWAARCFKTRSQAKAACDGGHAKIDGHTGKASQAVRVGVTVDVVCPAGRRILEVRALGQRRGSVEDAKALYIDHTPAPDPEIPAILRDARAGRPTKRDRRSMRKLKGW